MLCSDHCQPDWQDLHTFYGHSGSQKQLHSLWTDHSYFFFHVFPYFRVSILVTCWAEQDRDQTPSGPLEGSGKEILTSQNPKINHDVLCRKTAQKWKHVEQKNKNIFTIHILSNYETNTGVYIMQNTIGRRVWPLREKIASKSG